MLKEFKEFAMKGNVIDLATGVIIGAAFGKIVSSLVNDIVMPLLSLITGKTGFENLFIPLNLNFSYKTLSAVPEGVAVIKYGMFISNIVDFLVIAFSIFIIIKQLERFKKKPVPPESTTKICPYCQSSISIKATRCPFCTSEIK